MNGCNLGNPAPLGLLAFGMTTLLLMYVEMGWVEKEFEAMIYGVALCFGGLGQFLVAIFEIIKGSSFSFAVFGSYGFFWLAWAAVFVERHSTTSELGDFVFTNGMTAYFIQWGVLTFCFWVVTWRKNICLIVIFALLTITFFLLAIANARESVPCRKAAGYFGFFTAVGAFYTGIAELINEEYGRDLLPGLSPLHLPERMVITRDSISKRISYDKKSNTMMLYFRAIQINTPESIEAIRDGVESAVMAANAPKNKVHVIADYKDVTIAQELVEDYWAMAHDLEKKYYLSVRRFAVTSFGTSDRPAKRRNTAMSKVTSIAVLNESESAPRVTTVQDEQRAVPRVSSSMTTLEEDPEMKSYVA